MPVIHLRFDVPDADPETVDADYIADQALNRFNDWVRGTPQKGPELGLEVRDAAWEE